MRKLLLSALMAVAVSTAVAQDDWADFGHYEKQNAELMRQANTGRRVVFMGNSITELWWTFHPEFFNSHGYICRGISGQTTYQMVLRFRDDVIKLKPKVVVICAGENDIAENNHRYVEDRTFGNIVTMCEMAKAAHIKVLLGTLLPCKVFAWNKEMKGIAPKIKRMNDRLKDYAKKNKIPMIDYYTPLVDSEGGMKEELTGDGAHPKRAGYEIMEPIAVKAISKYVK